VLILAVAVSFLYGLWLAIPMAYGLPYAPTSTRRIRKALELAGVRPGEVVYDMGAGDGRVLVAAVRQYGARTVGIEVSPLHFISAWFNLRMNGCGGKARLVWNNMYNCDLSGADVVFAHTIASQAPRLRACLEAKLRPGARVVTVVYDLEGWQPSAIDDRDMVFLYTMPPTRGDVGTYLLRKEGQPSTPGT
jgi:predicted nicotinamide N-methyase